MDLPPVKPGTRFVVRIPWPKERSLGAHSEGYLRLSSQVMGAEATYRIVTLTHVGGDDGGAWADVELEVQSPGVQRVM